MSEAETIAELAVKAAAPNVIKNATGHEFAVWPDGKLMPITSPNAIPGLLPDHIEQELQLHTADSLVEYANRFKGPNSLILADAGSNVVRVVIDYHAPDAAQHVEHSAVLQLDYSVEWRLWTQAHGRMMSQLEFARFVEENGADIIAPTGADLLEIVRDLQMLRKVDFRKVVRTASGDERFEYTDETSAQAGGVEVPARFQLALPIYFGGSFVSLYAFLRHVLDDGKVRLGLSLNRAESVRQAEFKRIVTDIAERTGLTPLYGVL